MTKIKSLQAFLQVFLFGLLLTSCYARSEESIPMKKTAKAFHQHSGQCRPAEPTDNALSAGNIFAASANKVCVKPCDDDQAHKVLVNSDGSGTSNVACDKSPSALFGCNSLTVK